MVPDIAMMATPAGEGGYEERPAQSMGNSKRRKRVSINALTLHDFVVNPPRSQHIDDTLTYSRLSSSWLPVMIDAVEK